VAAAEFALIVPLLMLILAAIVDFGFYIHDRMRLDDLARATAEYVVQGGSQDTAVEDVVETSNIFAEGAADGTPLITDAGEECTCGDGSDVACDGSCDAGDFIRRYYTVTIEKQFAPLFAWPDVGVSTTIYGYARLQFEG
jgi:hypothetical protein